jgi:hypothetical protein
MNAIRLLPLWSGLHLVGGSDVLSLHPYLVAGVFEGNPRLSHSFLNPRSFLDSMATMLMGHLSHNETYE